MDKNGMITEKMQIILGSASKWRKEILRSAGWVFTTMSADIDERAIRHNDPEELALAIANAKADALLINITEPALLITADQVVVCKGKIYEKPLTLTEAESFIRSYSNSMAETVTAITVTDTATGARVAAVDRVKIYFREITDSGIAELLTNQELFYCAGGFQIETINGEFNSYVDHIDGSIDSVKGLPLGLTIQLLELLGV